MIIFSKKTFKQDFTKFKTGKERVRDSGSSKKTMMEMRIFPGSTIVMMMIYTMLWGQNTKLHTKREINYSIAMDCVQIGS
jgi:hypothetical protein